MLFWLTNRTPPQGDSSRNHAAIQQAMDQTDQQIQQSKSQFKILKENRQQEAVPILNTYTEYSTAIFI